MAMQVYCDSCQRNLTEAGEQEYICDTCNGIICKSCMSEQASVTNTLCKGCAGE